MKRLSIGNRLVIAAAAAAALAGPISAHALQFNSGDALLAVYGNGTEYVADLGSFSSLLTTGVTLDLSSIISSDIGPASSLSYTLVGYNGTEIFFGDRDDASAFSTLQKNQVLPATLTNALINWSGQLSVNPGNGGTSGNLFLNTDPLSFTKVLNNTGAQTLGGSIPSVHPGGTTFDTVLNLLDRTGAANTLTTVGTAILDSQTGHFVIAPTPVPVPAAAVLFATGVVGLIGVARRKVFGLQ